MTLTRSNIAIAVMALIIALLAWALVFYGRDEFALLAQHATEAIPTPSAVGVKEGFATITLSKESQAASGIVTAELAAANNQGATQVYGSVVNPQPLFELRAQYLAALSEARAQRIAIANSDNEFQRLKRLHADDRNVSERAVLEAQTRWRGDQAKLAAAEQTANTLKESLRAGWGDTVASWAGDPGSKVFANLSGQRDVLVQMIIPYELRQQAAKSPLQVGPMGLREGLRDARYVAPARSADTGLAGATFMFLTDAKDLRQGMRIVGRLGLDGEAREGVLIPPSAVVWHGGKAWVYVQEDTEKFVRREVNTQEELPAGWFNASGYEAGDKVVIRGAQLLLSEEQKFQIREENGD